MGPAPLRTAQDVMDALDEWLDTDEPLIEAIGITLAEYRRCDSQEQARRVVHTVIEVLGRHPTADGPQAPD